MAIIKTSNPALSENTFRNLAGAGYGGSAEATGAMTLNGTVNKTGILLVCAIATAAWTWHLLHAHARLRRRGAVDARRTDRRIHLSPWSPSSRRSGLRSPRPSTRCLRALCWAASPPCSTSAIPASPFRPWASPSARSSCCCSPIAPRVIKVTQKFRLGIVAATGGIMLFYLLANDARLLRHPVPRHQRLRPHRHRHSACSSSPSPPSTWCSISTSSSRASITALPNTWSGTAPSASWSRWSGSTLRSCGCSPKSRSRN